MSPRRSPGEGTLFYSEYAGLWVAGYTIDGKQYRVTAKNRNAVIRKRREMKKQLDAGVVIGTGRVKLGVYLDHWLTNVHKYRAKPKTFHEDTGVVNRHIKSQDIADKRLDKVTPQDVREMVHAIGSSRNAKVAYGLLRRALHDALKDGMIPRNPAEAVDKPKHTYKRHTAFTPQVALHIIRAAESSCDEMWTARWAAGFMTGLRESELLGLEWEHVNLNSDLIHVSWQLQELRKVHGCGEPVDKVYPCGKVRVSFCPQAHWDFPPGFEYRECERNLVWTRPKTQRSARGMPIIPPLHAILERLKSIDGRNPYGLVFHHPDGPPITQSQDQKAWRQLLSDAGVEHVGQHNLRRTAATLLRAAQVDEQTRMELFGHASTDVQRIYAGAELDHHRAAMGKLADLLAPQELD